jgi:hypothetical protein
VSRELFVLLFDKKQKPNAAPHFEYQDEHHLKV